jgi:hypothetical protein
MCSCLKAMDGANEGIGPRGLWIAIGLGQEWAQDLICSLKWTRAEGLFFKTVCLRKERKAGNLVMFRICFFQGTCQVFFGN